jgi:hypothetical protein
MINFGKILKRSWHNLWNYRMLWVFGFLLAVTGAGGGSSGNAGSGSSYQFRNSVSNGSNPNFQPGPFLRSLSDWFNQHVTPLIEQPDQHVAGFIWIGIAVLFFILVVGLIAALIRYPSEAAVIRMVDEYEQTGTKTGFKQGWKLGWNRRAFRIWVIDLVIGLPVFLFILLLLGLGLVFILSATGGNSALAVGATITTIACGFLFILVLAVFLVFFSLLRHFFVRAAALEGTGIGESFRRGWAVFKGNWKSAALMWLVMIGIGIGYGIIGLVLFFLLIPAYIVLFLPAVLIAAVPGLITGGVAALFGAGWVAWIVGGVVFLPVFLSILFVPLTVINGGYIIYSSSVWTLTYREIKALEEAKPVEIPADPS